MNYCQPEQPDKGKRGIAKGYSLSLTSLGYTFRSIPPSYPTLVKVYNRLESPTKYRLNPPSGHAENPGKPARRP